MSKWNLKRKHRNDEFALVHGVVTALRHNKKFVPEAIEGYCRNELLDNKKCKPVVGLGA